jgi:hypothetical protein
MAPVPGGREMYIKGGGRIFLYVNSYVVTPLPKNLKTTATRLLIKKSKLKLRSAIRRHVKTGKVGTVKPLRYTWPQLTNQMTPIIINNDTENIVTLEA